MDPPSCPHGTKRDNGKAGSLLLFGDLVFCTGDSLHGKPHPWVAREEEKLVGSYISQEFSSAASALPPCCVQWTQTLSKWGLGCFLLSLPLHLSCPDVQLIVSLFLTAPFSLLLLLGHAFNASEAMTALRFSVWFIFFPLVLWWIIPLKCFKFFRKLYMRRNRGHVLTLCVHSRSVITYSLNGKENLEEMKSQQDPESDSLALEKELNW